MISPVENPGKICRICLKAGEVPIYGTDTDLSEAVKIFGDIQIEKDDKFPKYLCGMCHSMLQSAILFRKQAKETELFLQEKNKSKAESSESVAKEFRLDSRLGGQSAPVAEHEEKIVSDKLKSKPICEKTESEFEVKKQCIVSPQHLPDSQEVNLQGTECSISCGACKLKFTSTSDYTLHKLSAQHKKSLKLYIRTKQCKICKKNIPSDLFEQHKKFHNSASKVCEICGKTYSSSRALHSHVVLHSSELPFPCEFCPYRSKTVSSYKVHLRTHTGEKPYTCEECGLGFTTKSNLIKHCLRHKEKQFKCNKCEKSYYNKSELENHVKGVHLRTEEFGCELCGKKYSRKKVLQSHEHRVHKKKLQKTGRKPLYLENERKP